MKAAGLGVGLVVVCLAATGGCQARLADQRDIAIEVGEIVSVPIDPVQHEQTIRVEVSSPDKPVNVHVYLQEHEEAVDRAITLSKEIENLLASANATEQATLEAAVPAGKVAIVRLQTSGPHSAKVHLELSN